MSRKKKQHAEWQPYRVRLFVVRTYEVEVSAPSFENAHLQAKIKLFEGRSRDFRRGRDLWAIESWIDAVAAPPNTGKTFCGDLNHPLFIVSAPPTGKSTP